MGATRNTGYLENLIQYDASDNVAIATSVNPSYKVTLGGSMLGTTGLLNATSTQLVLQNVNGGTNAERIGMFMNSNDTFKILSLNDNNTTRVDNILVANVLNGNVGIGTASPTNPLHIQSNTVSQLNVTALSGNTNAQINLEPTGTGIALIGPANNVDFALRTNASERMRITSAGDMYLTGRSTNGDYGMYFYSNDTDSRIYSSNSGAVSKSLIFYTSGAERMRITSGGDIYVNNAAALFFGLSAVTYLSASTSSMTFAVNNAPRMTITSGGNVMINTTSDNGYRLNVSGNIYASSSIVGNSWVYGQQFATTSASVSGVGTSFVNSGITFPNTTATWLVSIQASGDGNMYSSAMYVVTAGAWSKTLALIGGPSNHFGNGTIVAQLNTSEAADVNLQVRRTTSGSATVTTYIMKIG